MVYTTYIHDAFGLGDMFAALMVVVVLLLFFWWLRSITRKERLRENAYIDAYFGACADRGIDPVRGVKTFKAMEADSNKAKKSDFDTLMEDYVMERVKRGKGGSK